MTTLATGIPGSSNNGYVAAAYIVFFVIVLIYVAIMALRLTRVERSLRELNERAERPEQAESTQGETRQGGVADAEPSQRERETV
jgi:flagellar biosynthesis/type III secretory pathway M-ring protein FliF/YscJ